MRNFKSSSLPGLAAGKTYAPSPVWRGSYPKGSVRFVPLGHDRTASRKQCAKLYDLAWRFEQQTRQRFKRPDGTVSRQDGAIGRTGLLVLRAMLFEFINHSNGQLDPCYETLAAAANCSVRSVARAIKRLKAAGVIHWERQFEGAMIAGRWCLQQASNAYAVLAESNWRGFERRPPAPAPEPGTWGDHPPLRFGLDAGADAAREGATGDSITDALASDPDNPLGLQLASLARRLFPRS